MNKKIVHDIEQLSRRRGELEARAEREGRNLSAAEAALVAEIDGHLMALRGELADRPLTLPSNGPLGSHGSRSQAGPFRSFAEQLAAIRDAGIPGGRVDERLHQIRAAASGLSETVPSDGGFLLQPTFSQEIFQAAFETGKLARLCRRIPVTIGNSLKIPGLDETSRAAGSRHGGVRSYWLDEADEKQGSKPKFRQIELSLKKQVVLVYATDELLEDAPALEAYIRKVAADEISFVLDDAIVNGSGAGQPLGILNSGSLVTVAKEAGQSADTLLLENVVAMWSRMLGSSRASGVWLINQNVEPQLYTLSLSVGTGGAPVFLPGGAASAQPYMTLFGRPIIPIEQAATLGDVGDIILADFANGYVLAEKGGIQSDMSIHVRFVYDESVFRFVMRVDGQPMLGSAITPYKGGAGATQSHFVTLAERA